MKITTVLIRFGSCTEISNIFFQKIVSKQKKVTKKNSLHFNSKESTNN